jgi:hypothetical protein
MPAIFASSPPSKRPIFVIGAPRSGTTLLRYALCAHPHIYIPPESNFMTRFLAYPPKRPLSQAASVRLVNEVLDYKVFFRDWHERRPDPAAFVKRLPDRRPATLLHALYRAYARQHGARRWGDKSPIYADHVSGLATLFPSAQFVHIMRDGRDVALSMLKAYRALRFFYIDLGYAALSWHRRVRQARRDGSALGPARYFELKYERLTALGYELTDNGPLTLGERARLIGLRAKYAIVEAGRRALHRVGVVHPANLAAKLLSRRGSKWLRRKDSRKETACSPE